MARRDPKQRFSFKEIQEHPFFDGVEWPTEPTEKSQFALTMDPDYVSWLKEKRTSCRLYTFKSKKKCRNSFKQSLPTFQLTNTVCTFLLKYYLCNI